MTPRSLGHRYSYSVAQKSDCGAEGKEKSNWERVPEATQCTSMKIRGMWKYPQGPKPKCTERVLKFSDFPLRVYKYTDMTLPYSSACPAGKGISPVSHSNDCNSRPNLHIHYCFFQIALWDLLLKCFWASSL